MRKSSPFLYSIFYIQNEIKYTSQKIYEYLLKEQNEKDIERGSNEIIL